MKTKIVVIKFKELIKTAVFAVIGIAVIIFLIYIFIPKTGKQQALYTPGTYSASIILHNNPIEVDVTVSETEIKDIQLLNMGETQEVFYPLLEPSMDELAAEIIKNQSTEITASADKSTTYDILLSAVDYALAQARIEEN